MSDNTITLKSDSEVETSYNYTMRTFSNSHLPCLSSDYIRPKIVTLYNEFDSGRVYENILEEETSLFDLLDVLISNVGKGMNRANALMPQRLIRRGCTRQFTKERIC